MIYNDYAELSEMIGQYKAGWLAPPGNLTELETVVRLISEDPSAVRQASENARRLVLENLTYEKAITPLAEFCKSPSGAFTCKQACLNSRRSKRAARAIPPIKTR